MWWYREQKKGAAKVELPKPQPKQVPAGIVPAVKSVLDGRPRDPDALLMMAILVDSCVDLDGGKKSDGMSWLDAERIVDEALGQPARLYNRFSRECGDGYSLRTELPAEHAKPLEEMTKKLASAPGVRGLAPRSMRKSRISEPSENPIENVPAPTGPNDSIG